MIELYISVKRDIVMETCERESSDSLSSDSIVRLQDNGQYQGTQDRTHTSQSTITTYSTIQPTLTSQPTQVQLPRPADTLPSFNCISIPAIVGQSLGNTIGQTTKEIKVLNE